LVWLRFFLGVIVLGIAVIVRKQFTLPDKKEWIYFALLGFLGITFHQWLQSNALKTSEAGTSAWIVSTSPVFIALLGWLLLKESLNLTKTLGILLAFGGVLVIVSKGDLGSLSIGKFGAPGDKLILISSVSWAVFSVLSRRGLKTHPASLMMFYVMIFGWLLTTLLFIPTHGFLEFYSLTFNGWVAAIFLGIFCSGLAYIAWYDALKALSAAQTGAFLYIEPLVTVVVAFFILGETLSVASLIGGAITLFGVWLVNRPGELVQPTAETD
ncbi:MAG TPA: EamA family transporter, partial [Anaerolineales bacterium]|nr:EamA family transporter [Anaerolineales bacterium]